MPILMPVQQRAIRLSVILGLLLGIVPLLHAEQVDVQPMDGKIRVEIGGELFTEYIHADCENPFLYPVHGPHGIGMTRNYPMRIVSGESGDHLHHTSIWFAHDGINGVDFWRSANPGHGRVVHQEISRAESGDGRGVIETTNHWVGPDGKVECSDRRVLTFLDLDAGHAIDWQITLRATEGEVRIKDTEEGTMGIRTHPNLRLENGDGVTTANGQARNSEGVTGKAVWGKQAEWIDYWGKIKSHTVGIALFNHPSNPRHPTWWHARPYGLFTANPFGRHDFGDGPPGSGNMTIPAGDEVIFRYRILFHEGDPDEACIEKEFTRFSKSAAATGGE